MQRRTFLKWTVCTAAAGLAGCGKKAKLTAIAPGKTVLAFGDSVTYGTGAGAGEDWPTLLGKASGWRIVNAGVSGDTAEAAVPRLPPLLEAHRPALVIVELGGNDFLQRRAAAAVKEDLRRILREIRQSGAQAVLVAVPELSLMSALTRKLADAPLYAELAKEENVPLIDGVFADILSRPELCADQVHPNAQGYARMASDIAAHLKKTGLLA